MNSEILAFVSQSISTAIMNLLIFLYCKKMYSAKYSSNWIYMISYIITTVLFITVNRISNHLDFPLINFFYAFIYVNAVCLILFKEKLRKALLYNFFCFMFLVFSDIFTVILWTVMKGESLKVVLSNSMYVTISCLTNIFVMILGYSVFLIVVSKNEIPYIKLRQTIFIIVFSLFELYVEYNFAVRITNRTDGIVTMFMIVGFMLLNLCAVYVIKVTTNAYKTKYELELMKKQSEMQLIHFREMNDKYEKARRVMHDIDKHLAVMSSLNSNESKYNSEIEKEINSVFGVFKCSNRILSIIMSSKILEAEKKSIAVDTKIEDILFENISEIDLTAIFTNLWDNAIEACSKLSGERFINIIIGKVNDFCIVCFENSFNGEIKTKDDQFISLKPNHNGMGINIIKYTVGKYGGSLNNSITEKSFIAKIILPLS